MQMIAGMCRENLENNVRDPELRREALRPDYQRRASG